MTRGWEPFKTGLSSWLLGYGWRKPKTSGAKKAAQQKVRFLSRTSLSILHALYPQHSNKTLYLDKTQPHNNITERRVHISEVIRKSRLAVKPTPDINVLT